ncbi:hypothetical protein GC170_05500 [bacterium]|nr:hypothetical protein [bacterium]
MPSTVTVTCEQAVYGSFPFRDQGYDILTASAGCRPEWLAAFALYCRDLGQPPSEASPVVDRLLFARKIPAGPWVVALGSAQGCDDRGRPGAWAFHGLFLSNRDYRSLGASPFPLRPHLIDRFSAGMSLPCGPVEVNLPPEISTPETDPAKIRWISKGRKLRCVGSYDTFESTERFWRSLGIRVRSRRSLTTWAFRSDTPYHWSCISNQRIADESDRQDHGVLKFLPEELDVPARHQLATSRGRWLEILGGIVAISLAIMLIRSIFGNSASKYGPAGEHAMTVPSDDVAPAIGSFEANEMPRDVQDYLRERLIDWAERLGSEPGRAETGFAMEAARVAGALRYEGPLLTSEFRNDGDSLQSVETAIAYADLIRRHSAFRSWPDDHGRATTAPPAYALATLAWCVRSDELKKEASRIRTIEDARRWFDRFLESVLPASIPHGLPPTGLEGSHPELIEYRLHLSRIARLK